MANEYTPIKIHYDMIRDNEAQVVDKLDRELKFYRILFQKKIKGLEIIYDTPNCLLSGAGIVLSKQYDDGKAFFKVRRISYLPTEFRKPSQKFYLSQTNNRETPKDFPLQIATAINNAFSNVFTIDLVEVVKQTMPRYEIKLKGNLYSLTSGLGMKGQIVFEKVVYRDCINGRKVKHQSVTVTLPGDPAYKREVEEVQNAIEKSCKELLRYNESRFEIAQRILRVRTPMTKEERKAAEEKERKRKEMLEEEAQNEENK